MGWKFWQNSSIPQDVDDYGFQAIDKDKANQEYLTELLNIYQKSFDEKQETFKQIEIKARYFLTSFVVIFYAVLGFSLSQFTKLSYFSQVFLVAIIVPFILTAYALLFALVLRTRAEGFAPKGYTLENIKSRIEADSYDKKGDSIAKCSLLAKHCHINKKVNAKKANCVDLALWIFMTSPFSAFFSWASLAVSNHFGFIRISFNNFVGFGIVIVTSIVVTMVFILIRHFINSRFDSA